MRFAERLRRNSGFTMAEVLIASVLTALIGIAVLTSLRQGIVLWQKVDRPSIAGDVAIFFEKCAQNLENIFLLEPAHVTFSGDATTLSCPTSMKAWRYAEEWSMGLVRLDYDQKSGVLTRTVQTLAEIFAGKVPEPEVVFSDMAYFSLAYYYVAPSTGIVTWMDQWPPDIPGVAFSRWPQAVRIRLGLRREGKVYDFERILPIPLAR
jgi:hypothetical protein